MLSTTLAAQEDKLLACIHCGLCLEACPTYVITGDENDGPRGQLCLMRAVSEGRLENTSNAFSTHIDRCLGCRACEQVCPAGVEYGQLLEASREELLQAQPKSDLSTNSFVSFCVTSGNHLVACDCSSGVEMFRDLGLARLLLKSRLARLVSPRAEFGVALLESSRQMVSKRTSRYDTTAVPETVLLFAGCVGEGLFARVNRATYRVLRANNFNVARHRTKFVAAPPCARR